MISVDRARPRPEEISVTFPTQEIEARYEILHKLAEGGMGAVYKVRHRELEEERVIKVIRPQHKDSNSLKARFKSEAQAAIRLRHPNVAQVYDFASVEGGNAYLVMEYIEGMTLQDLLARLGPPPQDLTLEIARQTLAALAYLHQQGYVHRDIAPDNLMLTRHHQGGPMVKVIDLGLAKRQAGALQLTATGLFVGKVRYASPEQFGRSSRDADPRSDLYSFGVVLYELLTGVCPILGSSFEEIIASHVLQPPIPFAETDPNGHVSENLRRLVLGALEKNPEKRVATAAQFNALLTPLYPRQVPAFDAIRQRFDSVPPNVPASPPDLRVDPTDSPHALSSAETALRPEAYPPTLELPVTEPAASTSEASDEAERSEARESREAGRSARRLLFPALALVLLLAAALGLERWRTQAPAASGQVLLEAQPWAEITAITNGAGQNMDLEEGTHTPVLFSLPPGPYEIRLSNPEAGESRTIAVQVRSSETTRGTVDFGALGLDDYFESAGLRTILERAGS